MHLNRRRHHRHSCPSHRYLSHHRLSHHHPHRHPSFAALAEGLPSLIKLARLLGQLRVLTVRCPLHPSPANARANAKLARHLVRLTPRELS